MLEVVSVKCACACTCTFHLSHNKAMGFTFRVTSCALYLLSGMLNVVQYSMGYFVRKKYVAQIMTIFRRGEIRASVESLRRNWSILSLSLWRGLDPVQWGPNDEYLSRHNRNVPLGWPHPPMGARPSPTACGGSATCCTTTDDPRACPSLGGGAHRLSAHAFGRPLGGETRARAAGARGIALDRYRRGYTRDVFT